MTDEQLTAAVAQIDPDQLAVMRRIFWEWMTLHASDQILRLNIWIIHKTFTWRDLFPLFEAIPLIGPRPAASIPPDSLGFYPPY